MVNGMHARLYHMINLSVIWGLIILFILQPSIAHAGAEAGAQLFIHALLPYLLPYIILTQWLLKMPNRARKAPKWKRFLKAYVLGSFGGFPVGAVTVTEMMKNGELSQKQSGLTPSCMPCTWADVHHRLRRNRTIWKCRFRVEVACSHPYREYFILFTCSGISAPRKRYQKCLFHNFQKK